MTDDAPKILRVIYRRGMLPTDFRARVEVLDMDAFHKALGDRLTLELMKALAGVDILFGLFDAGAARGSDEGTRPHHTRLALATLSFGAIVEVSAYLRTFVKAMRGAHMDIPELVDVEQVVERWRHKSRDSLRNISFHFDETTIRRGLKVLEAKAKPVMLLEEREGLPCFEAGGRALYAGLTGLGDELDPLLAELRDDTVKLGHAMRVAIHKIVDTHRLATEFLEEDVEDKPLIMR